MPNTDMFDVWMKSDTSKIFRNSVILLSSDRDTLTVYNVDWLDLNEDVQEGGELAIYRALNDDGAMVYNVHLAGETTEGDPSGFFFSEQVDFDSVLEMIQDNYKLEWGKIVLVATR
jgi:hypothetical protein